MIVGHWYKFREQGSDVTHIGQYMGRTQGFPCCVCGKGNKAHEFNVHYDIHGGYETWGFGKEHIPEIIEDLGNTAIVIVDE